LILPPRGEIKKRSQIEGREKGAGQIKRQAKGYGEDSRIEKKGGEEREKGARKRVEKNLCF